MLLTLWLLAGLVRGKLHNEGELCFSVIGDVGGLPTAPYRTSSQVKVAALLAKVSEELHCKFVVGLGDNIYFSGVKDVDDPRFQLTFEQTYPQKALQIPWYMIAGNHDHVLNISAQIAYTKKSDRWNYPDYYYTKTFSLPQSTKKLQIVMIDTMMLCWYDKRSGAPRPEVQLAWIKNQLQQSTADYLIVGGHHPVYSAGSHGNTQCLINKLKPLLEKHRVTAYFSGHDHNLQHIKPLDSKVHYFVSGSGNFVDGRMSNKNKLPPKSLKFDHGPYGGFMVVILSSDHLQLHVLNSQAEKVYQLKIPPRMQFVGLTAKNINKEMPMLTQVTYDMPVNPIHAVSSKYLARQQDSTPVFFYQLFSLPARRQNAKRSNGEFNWKTTAENKMDKKYEFQIPPSQTKTRELLKNSSIEHKHNNIHNYSRESKIKNNIYTNNKHTNNKYTPDKYINNNKYTSNKNDNKYTSNINNDKYTNNINNKYTTSDKQKRSGVFDWRMLMTPLKHLSMFEKHFMMGSEEKRPSEKRSTIFDTMMRLFKQERRWLGYHGHMIVCLNERKMKVRAFHRRNAKSIKITHFPLRPRRAKYLRKKTLKRWDVVSKRWEVSKDFVTAKLDVLNSASKVEHLFLNEIASEVKYTFLNNSASEVGHSLMNKTASKVEHTFSNKSASEEHTLLNKNASNVENMLANSTSKVENKSTCNVEHSVATVPAKNFESQTGIKDSKTVVDNFKKKERSLLKEVSRMTKKLHRKLQEKTWYDSIAD